MNVLVLTAISMHTKSKMPSLHSGFVQTLKCFFPGLSRTCKDQIPGFSRNQKYFFQDFPGHVPFTNMGCMRSKKCIYKISYQCICITVKKQKCNTWGCIILFNSIKVFLILGLTQEVTLVLELHRLINFVGVLSDDLLHLFMTNNPVQFGEYYLC